MAGRRQHTNPRFLLRGFVSSIRKNEIYVWMYRKGAGGKEVNIKKVGVENDFYGRKGESDLDDRITADEDQYARILNDLRSHDYVDRRVCDDKIPNLIAHLCLRTRQIRESVLSGFDFMLKSLQNDVLRAEVFRPMLDAGVGPEGDIRKQTIARMIESGMSCEQANELISELFNTPGLVDELARECLPQAIASMKDFVNTYRSMLPMVTRASFIDSLSRNLEPEQRVAVYRKFNWFLICVESPLLLGDSACIFETTGKRRFKPIDDNEDDIRRVFLPISSNRLLVGTPTPYRPHVDLRVLNKAIARCSHEFFVSSQPLQGPDRHFCKIIGQWSGILSRSELTTLIEELKREWPTHIGQCLLP